MDKTVSVLGRAVLVAVIVAGVTARPASAQTAAPPTPAEEEAAVKAARDAFTVTGRELSTYRRVERRSHQEQYIPTTVVVGFYRGSELRKIEISQSWEDEDGVREECYFDRGQLLFRYRVAKRPGNGSGAGASQHEDRYYFAGGRLMRWVDADGQRIPPSFPSFPVAQRETMEGLKPVSAVLASADSGFLPFDPPSALLSTDRMRPLKLEALKLKNDELEQAVLYGEPVEFDGLPLGRDQPLHARLWEVAVESSCGRAGHMICGYRYFLAVAEKDDRRDAAVYDLGTFGTIEKLEWQPPQGGRIVLRMTALNFPAHVFEFWRGLERERGTFLLNVGIDSLTVRRIRPTR